MPHHTTTQIIASSRPLDRPAIGEGSKGPQRLKNSWSSGLPRFWELEFARAKVKRKEAGVEVGWGTLVLALEGSALLPTPRPLRDFSTSQREG